MKYTLCLIAALLPFLVNAQKFEVGVGAGIGLNTKPSFWGKGGYTGHNLKVGINFSGCIQGSYYFNPNISAGVSLHVSRFDNKQNTLSGEEVKYSYASPAVLINAFSNYHVVNKKSADAYIGISAGYLLASSDASYLVDNEQSFNGGNGFNAGLNLGYTHRIYKGLSANIEFAPRYCWVNSEFKNGPIGGGINNDYNLFYFPITIGIRYKF